MADGDDSGVIDYPYHVDFGGRKKNFVRSFFWREIQIQNWPILYEANFDLVISASQAQPRSFLIWSKIPPGGPLKNQKKIFQFFENCPRNWRFSKKTSPLWTWFSAWEQKFYACFSTQISSIDVELSYEKKKFMGWPPGVELLRAQVGWTSALWCMK